MRTLTRQAPGTRPATERQRNGSAQVPEMLAGRRHGPSRGSVVLTVRCSHALREGQAMSAYGRQLDRAAVKDRWYDAMPYGDGAP